MEYIARTWVRKNSGNPELNGTENYREYTTGSTTTSMIYKNARVLAHNICKSMTRSGEEYRFQIVRDDGYEWSVSPWFYFDGRRWRKKHEPQDRRQGARFRA